MFEFLTHPVPAVIVLLGVLVFIHELGHFLAGVWCGAGVEIFSLGFGPRMFGFRRGLTDYRVSWVPLGGYVKLTAMIPSEEVPPGFEGQEFYKLPVWKKTIIIAAGPLANFALAVVAYAVLGGVGISRTPSSIGYVKDGSAAERAGLMAGDLVTAIDGAATRAWEDIESRIARSPEKELTITVQRDEDGTVVEKTLRLTPERVNEPNIVGKVVERGRAGVSPGPLPSVIEVLDPASLAAKAGLKNGDEVVGVNVGGKVVKVKLFEGMLTQIAKARVAGQKTIELTTREASTAESVEGESANEQVPATTTVKTIDVSGLGEISGHRALAKAIGLGDAQLVVGEAREGLKDLFQRGDVLVRWDGAPLRDAFALRERLMAQASPDTMVTVRRAFEEISFKVTLTPKEVQGPLGKQTIYPLPLLFLGQPLDVEPWIERYPSVLGAMGYGVAETARQTAALVVVVGNLITGEIPFKAIGGPILIAKVAGDSAKRGWTAFVTALALISVNLGLLNLFPIPVLDGGQLILFGMESVRGKPVRESVIERFQQAGFAMLMLLIVAATYNDLARFWKSMVESVIGVFK